MGSFNETCMISGLPIGYGDDVRVILIKKGSNAGRSREGGCLCYPWDLWSPVSPPIKAKYSDYGVADLFETSKVMASFTLDTLNSILHPIEKGENQYHDIAVESLTSWDFLFNACHEGRFFLKNSYSSNPFSVATRVMVREDVWQSMLTHKHEHWRSQEPVTIGTYYTDCLKYFRKFVPDPNAVIPPGMTAEIASLMAEMEAERSSGDDLPFHYHFYGEGYSFTIKGEFFQKIKTKLRTGEWDMENPQFLELARAFAELAFVQYQFRSIGKMWSPVMTSGQDMNWEDCSEFHKKLAAISDVFVKEHRKERKHEERSIRAWEAKKAKKLAAKEKK